MMKYVINGSQTICVSGVEGIFGFIPRGRKMENQATV